MTDLSISCAAQIEDIEASKPAGSSTSAGTKLFRRSAVVFGPGAGVARTDPGPGDGDGRREEGVVNLTPGLIYGCLSGVNLKTIQIEERNGLTHHGSYV